MNFDYYSKPKEFFGRPTASTEAQVKYLLAVVRVKNDEIKTLRREKQALLLDRQFEETQFDRRMDALKEAFLIQKAPPIAPKKRIFWLFRWGKKPNDSSPRLESSRD